LTSASPVPGAMPRAGSLALVVGAGPAGAATGRLAMIHATGPAWHSMAGGRIDTLIQLDVRLGADEGGPAAACAGDPGRDHRPRGRPVARKRPHRPRFSRRRAATRRHSGSVAGGN